MQVMQYGFEPLERWGLLCGGLLQVLTPTPSCSSLLVCTLAPSCTAHVGLYEAWYCMCVQYLMHHVTQACVKASDARI